MWLRNTGGNIPEEPDGCRDGGDCGRRVRETESPSVVGGGVLISGSSGGETLK